jgi:hypothetical protein
MTLVRIEAPHFVAGIVFNGQVCVEAAPIVRWCLGKRAHWLKLRFERNGWVAKRVTQ